MSIKNVIVCQMNQNKNYTIDILKYKEFIRKLYNLVYVIKYLKCIGYFFLVVLKNVFTIYHKI